MAQAEARMKTGGRRAFQTLFWCAEQILRGSGILFGFFVGVFLVWFFPARDVRAIGVSALCLYTLAWAVVSAQIPGKTAQKNTPK